MVLYVIAAIASAAFLWWLGRSPILRAMLRGHTTDPGQFGTWQDHLDDIGLGASWRSDGRGGRRETQVMSKHTRRR